MAAPLFGAETQDYVLGDSQPSLRDWIMFSNPTQD
jgi:hypothetical protein